MTLINFDVLWSHLWRYALIVAFFFGLGFMLGCGPQEELPIVTTDEFVGQARTELIQYLGSANLCVDFDNPIQKEGVIAFAALAAEDGKSGQILPRCSEFVTSQFRCKTDLNYEVAGRLITACDFHKGVPVVFFEQ